MPEIVKIVLSFVFLVAVFVLTRYLIAFRLKRAAGTIIADLEKNGAYDPVTAADLPYAKESALRVGMRNYHAKALTYMVTEGVVGVTGGGKYYLRVKQAPYPFGGSGESGQSEGTPT